MGACENRPQRAGGVPGRRLRWKSSSPTESSEATAAKQSDTGDTLERNGVVDIVAVAGCCSGVVSGALWAFCAVLTPLQLRCYGVEIS